MTLCVPASGAAKVAAGLTIALGDAVRVRRWGSTGRNTTRAVGQSRLRNPENGWEQAPLTGFWGRTTLSQSRPTGRPVRLVSLRHGGAGPTLHAG